MTADPAPIDLADFPDVDPMYSPLLCERAIIAGLITYSPGRAIWRGRTAHLRNPLALFTNERERDVATIVLDMPDEAGFPDVCEEVFERRKVHEHHPAVTIKYFTETIDAMLDMRDFDRCFAVTLARAQRRAVAAEASKLAEDILAGGGQDIDATVTAAADKMRRYIGDDTAAFTPSQERTNAIVERLMVGDGSEKVPTSHHRLRRMAGAWPKGQLSLVAAPTGMGKTAFLLGEAFAAARSGLCVWAWLSESSEEQVFIRWCSQTYQIDANDWTSGKDRLPNGLTIKSARDRFAALVDRLYLVCRKPASGDTLEADLLAFASRRGAPPDLVLVDHLQTLDAPSGIRCASHEHGALHANAMSLWRMSAQTGAAVIVASQYNRDAIDNLDDTRRKRPSLAALKGSGTPAEKAKVVVFLHEPEAVPAEQNVMPAEIVVAKANDGRLGAVPALYIRPLTLWLEDTPENRHDWVGTLERYDAPEPADPSKPKSAPKGRYAATARKDVDG